MVDINSTLNTKQDPNQATDKEWDVKSLLAKVLELQDLLMQSQEKNLLLSAQARELERAARDAEDLKAELSAQGLVLADKARENKTLHQEFSHVSSLMDAKIQELEETKGLLIDLEQQLKGKDQERDILLVMLNEMEDAQKRTQAELAKTQEGTKILPSKDKSQTTTGNWLRHITGQK